MEDEHQGSHKFRFWWDPSPWLADNSLLAAFSHGLSSVLAAFTEKAGEMSSMSSKDTNSNEIRDPSFSPYLNLIISSETPLPHIATLVVMALPHEFWEYTNIHSIRIGLMITKKKKSMNVILFMFKV